MDEACQIHASAFSEARRSNVLLVPNTLNNKKNQAFIKIHLGNCLENCRLTGRTSGVLLILLDCQR